MKRYIQAGITVTTLLAPFIAFATTNQKLSDIISILAGYLDSALKLLMGFAVLAFVYYVIRYFILQSDDTKRAAAASYVMWSLIGFFVILSLWGLVNILISTFNLGNSSPGSLTDMSNIFPK